MAQLTESVAKMIDEFAKLPGIGRKSAERLAYHVLRVNKAAALALADAIRDVKENVHYCQICFHLAEGKSARSAVTPSETRRRYASSNNRET